MSTSDALALVNQAFLQLGEAAIDSFDGGSVPQQAAAATYQSTTDALLGGHPWWWNRKIVALTRLTDVPPVAVGFSAAYQLPPLCFRVVVPYVDGRGLDDWGLAGDMIYLDAEATAVVELEFHTRVEEANFAPLFRQALISQLAADMTMAITGDMNLWKLNSVDADGDLRRARAVNASEKPARRLMTGNLQARMRR